MSTRFTLHDLRQCLADHLERDLTEIGEKARLVEDLGIDSLAMHALLIEIEDLGGRIPDPEALERVCTVAELYAAVVADALP